MPITLQKKRSVGERKPNEGGGTGEIRRAAAAAMAAGRGRPKADRPAPRRRGQGLAQIEGAIAPHSD